MIYPRKIAKGSNVGVVSLSSGVLGEPFAKHELSLIEKRLPSEFGLDIKYLPNSLKGEEYLKNHPEKKAEDLITAFKNPEIDLVWSALGGDDTFRTLPYLMNDKFKQTIQNNPKPFLGFSDTTNNHLMFYKLGLSTLYAPALLSDIAELGPEIFTYTRSWLHKLFEKQQPITIHSSPVWYEARTVFDETQLGIPRKARVETHGHEYLFGSGIVEGELLGGCLDSLYEMLAGGRYDDQLPIYQKYPIFPSLEQWNNKIIFLETSEERPSPAKLEKMLETLAAQGIFNKARGLIIGKPQDEIFYDEYKKIYQKLAKTYYLPTVYNLNFGHTAPRIILPYGKPMRIDFDNKKITLTKGLLGN